MHRVMEGDMAPPSLWRRPGDVISGLPDEVLCHILSFLQTTDAVSTSILSRRWRHVWKSVPYVDLDFWVFLRRCRQPWEFSWFLDYVTLSRVDSGGAAVRRLRLNWCVPRLRVEDLELAASCIVGAASSSGGCLRELYLSLDTFARFPLERMLHGTPLLEKLRLQSYEVSDVALQAPPCLRRLRTLCLRNCRSVEATTAPGTLEMLINGCPSLEELTLDDCSFHRLHASVPNLVKLKVMKRGGCGMGGSASPLPAHDPGLWCLRGSTRLVHVLVVEECIDLGLLAGLLGDGTASLESLELNFVSATQLPQGRYPVFQNLKTLKLFVCIMEETIKAMTHLLSHLPCLEILKIKYVTPYCLYGGDEVGLELVKRSKAACSSKSLKEVVAYQAGSDSNARALAFVDMFVPRSCRTELPTD